MTIRALQSVGVLALLGAGCTLWLCVREASCPAGAELGLASADGVVAAFEAGGGGSPAAAKEVPPLVAAARAFALILDPPAPVVKGTPSGRTAPPAAHAPAIRPAVASPRFRVIGTSCPEIHPERAMALIVEPGTEAARWVREGEQVGHVTIHEIKPGTVVYRSGDELSEMAVVRDTQPPAPAGTGLRADPDSPRAAAADVPTVGPSRPVRRPAGARGRTVGSARSAALN